MPTKPWMGSRDAAQVAAKASAHRLAGAFDRVGRPARSAGEAVGGGQRGDQRVELLTSGGSCFSVAPFLGLLELLFQLGDPAPVVGAGCLVDDRLAPALDREPGLGRS